MVTRVEGGKPPTQGEGAVRERNPSGWLGEGALALAVKVWEGLSKRR